MHQHYWALSLCFLSSIVLGAVVPSLHNRGQLLSDGEAALEPRYHGTIEARDILNPQRGEWYGLNKDHFPGSHGAMILNCISLNEEHPEFNMCSVVLIVHVDHVGDCTDSPLRNYVLYPTELGKLRVVIRSVWQDELKTPCGTEVSFSYDEQMVEQLECDLEAQQAHQVTNSKINFARDVPRETYEIKEFYKVDYPPSIVLMFIMEKVKSEDVATFAALGPPGGEGRTHSTLAQPYLPQSGISTSTKSLLEEYNKKGYVFFKLEGVPTRDVTRPAKGSAKDFSLTITFGKRLEKDLNSLV